MKKRYRLLILFLFFPVFLNAQGQTADLIESLLQTRAVSYEQAAWFVVEALDIGNFNPQQALVHAIESKWLPERINANEKITLQRLAHMVIQAFEVPSGPMYTIFSTPNYAYRDLVQQNIIQGRTSPGMDVTGEMLLFIVNRVLFILDDNPWVLPPVIEPEVIEIPEEIFIAEEPEEIIIVQEEPEEIIADVPEIELPMGNLTQRLLWLSLNAEDGGEYIIDIDADEGIEPHFIYYGGKEVNITLIGDHIERIIGLKSKGSMFIIGSGVTFTLGNNVTFTGLYDNSDSLIIVDGGELIINNGAKITGNKAFYGGGVHLLSGNLTMNGGTITGNIANNGSGVYVGWDKTFVMNGGSITGNSGFYGGGVFVSSKGTFTKTSGNISGNIGFYGGGVYVSSEGTFVITGGNIFGNTANYSGGGVYVSNGAFLMRSGIISGNTAGNNGGGVHLYYYSTFIKTGGIIYGYDNERFGNIIRDSFGSIVQNGWGHAVYVSFYSDAIASIIKLREITSGLNDNLSFTFNNGLPVWSGGWIE